MGFETDIERMYRAGKTDIPNAADHLSGITAKLYNHLQTFNQQSALAGDPAIMTSMLQVGGDLYDVLRGGVESLNNCASAVIKTADDYVAVDDQALADYQAMDSGLKSKPLPDDAPIPSELKDPEGDGAVVPKPQGETEHTDSTPDPVSRTDDAQTRRDQEETSRYDNEREKRRG